MQKAISYAARLVTLLTLLGLLYYTVNDEALVKYDNRNTFELCRDEVQGGCPLLLEALEDKVIELENLKKTCVQTSIQADGGLQSR